MSNQEEEIEEEKIKIIEKIYNKYIQIMDKLSEDRKKLVLSFLKKREKEKIEKIQKTIANKQQ